MTTHTKKKPIPLADRSNAEKLELVATRDGYGKGLVEAGKKDERIVVLCADLTESTRSHWFAEAYPERFIELGVAEQDLALIASGMAAAGKIPFMSSYATFSPGRNNEQIRTNICLNNLPVKVAGAHAGVSVGPDGATHQALEDIALMRAIPRMVVVVPCDAIEAQKATVAAAFNERPTYLRLGRAKSPVITTMETPFEIGTALVLREGDDCALIACGILVYEALLAAEQLAEKGIQCTVINNHTIKPMDEKTIVNIAQRSPTPGSHGVRGYAGPVRRIRRHGGAFRTLQIDRASYRRCGSEGHRAKEKDAHQITRLSQACYSASLGCFMSSRSFAKSSSRTVFRVGSLMTRAGWKVGSRR
jgi:transketolase